MTILKAVNILLDTCTEGLEFVLRQLEKQDMVPDSPQSSFLKFGKIVAFSYSTGAGTTGEYCAQNEECDAVLLLYDWLETLDDPLLRSVIS